MEAERTTQSGSRDGRYYYYPGQCRQSWATRGAIVRYSGEKLATGPLLRNTVRFALKTDCTRYLYTTIVKQAETPKVALDNNFRSTYHGYRSGGPSAVHRPCTAHSSSFTFECSA